MLGRLHGNLAADADAELPRLADHRPSGGQRRGHPDRDAVHGAASKASPHGPMALPVS
jgi:hypothetical protein